MSQDNNTMKVVRDQTEPAGEPKPQSNPMVELKAIDSAKPLSAHQRAALNRVEESGIPFHTVAEIGVYVKKEESKGTTMRAIKRYVLKKWKVKLT